MYFLNRTFKIKGGTEEPIPIDKATSCTQNNHKIKSAHSNTNRHKIKKTSVK